MIFGLTPFETIFAVFVCWMTFLAILWLREIVRNRRFDWQMNQVRLFHCNRCHHTFLINDPANLTRCPRCNAVCIRRRSGPGR